MMLWQFKTLASVRQGLDSGKTSKELAKSLGLHPYVLEKSINQVRKFNLVSLQNAINRLIDLDFKSKTGQGKLEELLPVVLVSL
jgi:DNA polymerase-3 subunit delta